MLVTLMGPDELGNWFLADEDGNSFPLVARHEDHPAAAALFGWKVPESLTDDEETIQNALEWLMRNIGEEIEAPKHVVDFFREMEDDDEDDE